MDPVFDNKWHSSDPASSVAMIARLVLCIFALTVRLYCKKLRQTQKFISWDDGFIILALVSITVSEGICLWGFTKGADGTESLELIADGDYKGVQEYLMALFISSLTDYFTMTFIRLSILCFYLSIFGTESKFRAKSLGITIICILWAIACIFADVFMCTPIDHYWKPLSPGICHDFMLFYLITEIIETVLDAAILILPIKSVLALQLPTRIRLSILGIFLLGGFVIVSSALRLKFIYQPHQNLIDTKKASLWVTIHTTVAFLCACLPLCKPFFAKVVEGTRYISSFTRSLLASGRLSSRTYVSAPQYGTPGTRLEGDASSAENSYRLQQYGSKASFKLDPHEHTYKAEVRTNERGETNVKVPQVINVQSEYEVV